jgi:hypothetical protein
MHVKVVQYGILGGGDATRNRKMELNIESKCCGRFQKSCVFKQYAKNTAT